MQELQPVEAVEAALSRYGDLLYRLCLVTLRNASDAEDAVQETLLAYLARAPVFNSPEHEKAWLLRVAVNKCRDVQRFRLRHPQLDETLLQAQLPAEAPRAVMHALLSLPERFRLVLTLHYVEGYRVNEIAGMIGRSPSAVKMRLQKGRRLLEAAYRKEQ